LRKIPFFSPGVDGSDALAGDLVYFAMLKRKMDIYQLYFGPFF